MTSTKGRKPHPDAVAIPDSADATKIALASQAADLLSATEQQVLEAAEVYRMVGRIEAAQFLETVSGRVMAETYVKTKALIGKTGSIIVCDRTGQVGNVSGMEAFCEAVMPISARRCRQIIAAIDTLGVELYEQAEQIGFRARDYQALRALPDDQQAVVKRAIEAGDLNAAVDIVHELASRNSALQNKLTDSEKTAGARTKVIASKDETINRMQEAEERRRSGSPSEREQAQLDDVRSAGLAAEMAVRQLLAAAGAVVAAPATEAAATAAHAAVGFVAQVLAGLINERGLVVDLADMLTPHWLNGIDAPGGQAHGKRSQG